MLHITAWSGNYYSVSDRDTLCLILQPGVGVIMPYLAEIHDASYYSLEWELLCCI